MATDSSALSLIPEMRTNGAQISDETPSEYQRSLGGVGKRIQSANHLVTVSLNFISDDILTFNLSRGQTLTNTMSSAAPAQNQYSLMLVAPTTYANSNYYFPVLSTIKTRKLDYQKGKPLTTEITFSVEDRNVNTVLYYQESLTNLSWIMGSRYPL